MKVKWLGHAAFLFTGADGTRVLTDPYIPGAYDGQVGYGKINEVADIVTVSHEHADHNGARDLPGSPTVLRGTGDWTIKGWRIFGVASYHDPQEGRERGVNTIFVYQAEGLRLAHLGDLGHILEPATVKRLGGVDVLLIPVGGVFTIDAREANQVVAALAPKVVIPMHYKTPKLGFGIAGVEEFLKLAAGVRRTNRSEVEITREGLPAATETWVLLPAL